MCLIYCRVKTYPGIKVEMVSGGEGKSPAVWKAMARQVYCENGRDSYREMGHFSDGAPFLWDEPNRISLTDTSGLLAVATLAPTPDENLESLSPHTALGIDAERADRKQARSVRSRFLSDGELEMVDSEDTEKNVLAWVLKEAMLKAVRNPGVDIRSGLRLLKLPVVADSPREGSEDALGKGEAVTPSGETFRLDLFAWREENYIMALAYSPESERWR